MSLAVDNIDVLRHGWDDAVSTVTPDLSDVRAAMEDEFAGAVADARLDEESLLAAVRNIVSVASKSGGADNARLLSKALHRSVYEYLLSLDALTAEETDVVDRPLGRAADPSMLIGFEEVAELEQRQSAQADAAAESVFDALAHEEASEPAAGMSLADDGVPGEDGVDGEMAADDATAPDDAEPRDRVHYRPRFRLFRRGEHHADDAATEALAADAPDAEVLATDAPATGARATEPPAASAPESTPASAASAPPPPPAAVPPPPPAAPEWWRGPAVAPPPEPPAPEATVARLAEAMAEIAGENDDFEELPPAEPEAPISAATEPETALTPPPPEPEPAAPEGAPEAAPDDGPPTTWRVRDREQASPWPGSQLDDVAAFESAEVDGSSGGPASADTGLGPLEAWAVGAEYSNHSDGLGTTFVTEAPPGNGHSPEDSIFSVAPREGFHLTEDDDFVTDPLEEDRPPSATPAPKPPPVSQRPAEADEDEASNAWHIRRNTRPPADIPPQMAADALADMLDAEADDDTGLLEHDPFVVDARNEINDRLRRRRCDEAASLLQRLAADVGGRLVAELALDAGDRCRALGKANAALSCYIAASRADPVFEAPLLRLADICLDDRDIDLAVTYLDRVARLHRMRGDTRGALRIYRKIATIAPYRDDILATLMRANSTGQFED